MAGVRPACTPSIGQGRFRREQRNKKGRHSTGSLHLRAGHSPYCDYNEKYGDYETNRKQRHPRRNSESPRLSTLSRL